MLGAKDTFFYKPVGPLVEVMGAAGEELKRQQAQVEQVLKTEEEQFARTLERGLALLYGRAGKTDRRCSGRSCFPSVRYRRLPVDLATADVCRERNIKVDEAGFEAAMEEAAPSCALVSVVLGRLTTTR
ncbi:alanine--tRNA ligase-related protein [Shigella flexneri]